MNAKVTDQGDNPPTSRKFSAFKAMLNSLFDLPWKKIECLEALICCLIGIIQCIVFASYLNYPLVINDTLRHPILLMLSILCPISSLSSIVAFKLQFSPPLSIKIVRFVILIVTPLTIMISLIGSKTIRENLHLFVASVFIPCRIVSVSIYKPIRKLIIQNLGFLLGGLISIVLSVLLSLFFILIIYSILVSENFTKNPASVISYIATFYLIFIISTWILIHMSVFKDYPSGIEELSSLVQNSDSPSLIVKTILKKHPHILDLPPKTIFSNKTHLISSAVILLSVIGTEIGVISTASATDTASQGFIISIFYIIIIPIFMFGGTLFSSSILEKSDKYFVILVFVALLPTVLVMWLAYTLYSESNTHTLGILIAIGFPASLIYWLSMIMVYDYSRNSYQYISAFCCVVIIVPIGFIWPLYASGVMKSVTFKAVIGILCASGGLILCLWLFQIFRRLSIAMLIIIRAVKPFNSYECSQYLYSSCFLLGFSFLAWMSFRRLSSGADWISGIVPGCFTIFAILLISTLFIHRVSLHSDENDEEEENLPSFKDLLLGSAPTTSASQAEFKKAKKKYQMLLAIIGSIITFMISIPILASSESETNVAAGVIIIIGTPIALLIIILLIELKGNLRYYGEKFTSYSLGCCWIFCFFPIFCLIPISLASAQTSSDIRNVTSWSIGLILVIFMFGVSAGSISLNYFFRRLEYEKIAKYCCLKTFNTMKSNGVNVKMMILRSIYDNYKMSDKETAKSVLETGDVFYYLDVDENEPDLRFSKVILTAKEISNIKKGVEKEKKKKVNKGKSLLNCCKSLCVKTPQIFTEMDDGYVDPANSLDEFGDNEQTHKLGFEMMEKLKNQLMNEPPLHTVKIAKIELTSRRKSELINSNYFKILSSSKSIRNEWLRICFSRFSSGEGNGDFSMNLSDLRQFMRLSGLKPFISYATCDILYTKLTRIYDQETSTVKTIKMTFKNFLENLLLELCKMRYPHLTLEEAENLMFREDIFPNIANSIPKLYQECGTTVKRGKSMISISNPYTDLPSSLNRTHMSNSSHAVDDPQLKEYQKNAGKNENRLKRCAKALALGCGKCLDKFKGILVPTVNEENDKRLKIEIVEEKDEIFERILSPEWKDICEMLLESIEDADKYARVGDHKEDTKMEINMSNIMAIVGHVSEVYSFSAIAFAKEVGWESDNGFTKMNEFVIADSPYWIEIYWFCFASCIIFAGFVIPAIKYIKKGRFGLNEDFTIATFPSFQFFLSKIIGFLGNSMYFTIMSSLLSSFACSYVGSQWKLMRVPDVVCFDGQHITYFILAILALIIYYPFSTLLYPNIAFQDKTLDIQFDTSFLVIESQGKLIIAGFAAFFAKEVYIWLQLIVCISVCFMLMLVCALTKPCLIKSYNMWKAGGYITPIWICLCALFNYYTKEKVAAIVLIVIGLTIALAALIFLHKKKPRIKLTSNVNSKPSENMTSKQNH